MDLKKYIALQPFIFSLFLAAGLLAGYKLADSGKNNLITINERNNELRPAYIDNTVRLIESQYLFTPDYNAMTDDILFAIANNLDQYSAYVPPSKLSHVTENLNAIYSGLGMTTINYNDSLLVTEVIANSPAYKAGITTLEKIVKVNGKDVTVMDHQQMSSEFGLSEEKDILLTISARDFTKRNVKVKSEVFEIPTVTRYFIHDVSTLYVKISRFSNHTFREFMDIVEKHAVSRQVETLIIDLRNNPGGYLQEVVKILDQLFDRSGIKLVETAYRDGRRDVIKTTGRNFYDIKNVRVLINENSISGSEVLAGSLQDLDRAVILGRRSFGKGLVQDQYDLFNGGAMRLTVANYYLPSGRSIQKQLQLPNTENNDLYYTEKDTFYSLVLNRYLYSGGGIEPDVILMDSTFELAANFLHTGNNNLLSMLADLVFNDPDLIEMDENLYKNADYFGIGPSDFLDEHDFMDKKALSDILGARLGFLLFGQDIETEMLVKSDPWITMALENHTLE